VLWLSYESTFRYYRCAPIHFINVGFRQPSKVASPTPGKRRIPGILIAQKTNAETIATFLYSGNPQIQPTYEETNFLLTTNFIRAAFVASKKAFTNATGFTISTVVGADGFLAGKKISQQFCTLSPGNHLITFAADKEPASIEFSHSRWADAPPFCGSGNGMDGWSVIAMSDLVRSV
jgi:hypothetical protein